MRDAIADTGRPIFLNIKQDIHPGGFGAACALANSFRVSDDIKPCRGETGLITDIASAALKFAGPGCFLDLDSLEVGVDHGCPNEGASTTASNELTYKNWKAQLALWVRFVRCQHSRTWSFSLTCGNRKSLQLPLVPFFVQSLCRQECAA